MIGLHSVVTKLSFSLSLSTNSVSLAEGGWSKTERVLLQASPMCSLLNIACRLLLVILPSGKVSVPLRREHGNWHRRGSEPRSRLISRKFSHSAGGANEFSLIRHLINQNTHIGCCGNVMGEPRPRVKHIPFCSWCRNPEVWMPRNAEVSN